ncbi:unnamed protein product [Ixodes persulcatus]
MDICCRMLDASSELAVLSNSLAVRRTDSRLVERLFSSARMDTLCCSTRLLTVSRSP